jgi:hypothetical protein
MKKNIFDSTDRLCMRCISELASVKRYQSSYLGDKGGGGGGVGGLHPIVIIRPVQHSRLGQSDCYQDNNKLQYFIRIAAKEKKKKPKSQKGIQTSDGEGIWVYISLLITNKPSRIYAILY